MLMKSFALGLVLAVMACKTNSMLPVAQAMTPAHLQAEHWTMLIKKDLSQYDPKILLSRGGCGFGQVMGINGSCEPRAGMRQERRQERRHERRCAHRVGGVCLDKHDRDNGDIDE